MGMAPAQFVEAPARSAAPYGLFSVLSFRPGSDPHWQNGITWQAVACGPVRGIGEPTCDTEPVVLDAWAATTAYAVGDQVALSGGEALQATVAGTSGAVQPVAPGVGNTVVDGGVTWLQIEPPTQPVLPEGLPKNFDDDPFIDGEAGSFTLYAPYECSPVGTTPTQANEFASQKLQLREEQGAERAFWTGYLGNTPNLRAADGDVTTIDTGVSPVVGLALLERFAGDSYGGSGVIHLTRDVATLLAQEGALVASGASLRTVLGTPVVAGTGYDGSGPDGTAAPEGTAWGYVTPPVFGYRGEIFSSSNRDGDLFDRSSNDLYAIAERTYLIAYDPCGVGAVQMTLYEAGA